MRARAGDPPRTMTQKILAGRADDPNLNGDLVRVKVDQVVLAREPDRTLAEPVLAEFEVETCPVGDPERYWESVTIGDITYIRNAAGRFGLYRTAVDPELDHNLVGAAGMGDLVERFRNTADLCFANSPAQAAHEEARRRSRQRR